MGKNDAKVDSRQYHKDHSTQKSLYKPYWNSDLQKIWDVTNEKEKKWLKCKESASLRRRL